MALGEAFVNIKANTDGFLPDLNRKLREALKVFPPAAIKTTVDPRGLSTDLKTAVKLALETVNPAFVKLAVDPRGLSRDMKTAVKLALEDVNPALIKLGVDPNPRALKTDLKTAVKLALEEVNPAFVKLAVDPRGLARDMVAAVKLALEKVNPAFVKLAIDPRGIAAQLRAIQRSLPPIRVRVILIGPGGGPFNGLPSGARSAADKTNFIIDGMVAKIKRALLNIPQFAATAFAGIAVAGEAAFLGLGALGVKLGADVELLNVSLKNLARSTETTAAPLLQAAKAGESFETRLVSLQDAIREFAFASPLGVNEITDAVIRLTSSLDVSGEQALNQIDAITSALAISPGQLNAEGLAGVVRALTQIASAGKLGGQELLQLSNQIPTLARVEIFTELAKQLIDTRLAIKGVSEETDRLTDKQLKQVKKLQREGEFDSSEALNAILISLKNTAGAEEALEEFTKTFTGRLQALTERLKFSLGTLFLEILGPIADGITKIVESIVPAIEDSGFVEKFRKQFDEIASGIAAAAPAILKAISAIGDGFTALFRGIGADGLSTIAGSFALIGRAIGGIGRAIQSDAFAGFLTFLGGLRNAVGGIFSFLSSVLGPLLSALIEQMEGFRPLLDAIGGAFKFVGDKIAEFFDSPAGQKFQEFLRSDAAFIAIAAAIALLGGPITLVVAGLAAIALGFQKAWESSETFREIVAGVVEVTANVIKGIAVLILGLAFGFLETVSAASLLGSAMVKLTNLITVGEDINDPFADFRESARTASDFVRGLIDDVMDIPTRIDTTINVKVNFIGGDINKDLAEVQNEKNIAKRINAERAKIKLRDPFDFGIGKGGGASSEDDKAKKEAEAIAKRFAESIRILILDLRRSIRKELINGTAESINQTLTDLSIKIGDIFRDAGKKVPSGLLRRIKLDNLQLQALANERERILKQLAAAQAKFSETRNAALEFGGLAGAIDLATTAVTAAGKKLEKAFQETTLDVAGSFRVVRRIVEEVVADEESTEKIKLTTTNLIASFKTRLAALRAFRQDIDKLAQGKLDKGVIDQLVLAGVEGGAETADALVKAKPAVISELNKLQGELVDEANKLGGTATDSLFRQGKSFARGVIDTLRDSRDATKTAIVTLVDGLLADVKAALKTEKTTDLGIDIVRGIVAGLKSKRKDVRDEIAALIADLVKEVKTRLKIKSPSQVAEGLFSHFGDGAIRGLEGSLSGVTAAGGSMADALAGLEIPEISTLLNLSTSEAQQALDSLSVPAFDASVSAGGGPAGSRQQGLTSADIDRVIAAVAGARPAKEIHAPITQHFSSPVTPAAARVAFSTVARR